MALALGAAGASIVLASRNVEQLSGVKQAVENVGGKALVFQANVLEEEQILKLEHDVLRAFNGVHILINNAGINLRKQLVEFTLEEWQRVLDTNLTSVFLMCRSFVPHMKGKGYGRVINLSPALRPRARPFSRRTLDPTDETSRLGRNDGRPIELIDDAKQRLDLFA